VLVQERGHQCGLAGAGDDGAQRLLDVERARLLTVALAVSDLNHGGGGQRLLATLRAGDRPERLVHGFAAVAALKSAGGRYFYVYYNNNNCL